MTPQKPTDSRHALFIGYCLGLAVKHDLPLTPVIDADGDYTSTLLIETADAPIQVVIPYPDPDWRLP